MTLSHFDVVRYNYNLLLITCLSLYSQDGDTALRWAAYHNNVDLMRVILDHTVQIDVKNNVSIIKTTSITIYIYIAYRNGIMIFKYVVAKQQTV